MIRLNAGSGWQRLFGWINVDLVPDKLGPGDLRADVTALPLAGHSIDRIFASHLLEHLYYESHVPAALAEFRRVLAPGGELCVVGPDIERAVLTGQPHDLLRSVVHWPPEFGDMSGPGGHKWTATGTLTERALTAAGFRAECFSGHLDGLRDLGWPLAETAAWQQGYLAVVRHDTT